MKMLSFVTGFFCLMGFVSASAQSVTISGYIKDASSGETLIGATVYAVTPATGTVTNGYGFFSLTIPKGEQLIRISYLGYVSQERTIVLDKDLTINIDLEVSSQQLSEVVVSAQKENNNIIQNEMSVATIEASTIKKVPSILGEADVFRTLQLLPGVTTVADGAAGFNVRGGAVDQNLILLDEGTLYNATHLLGLYSAVNPDAVKDLKLYKAGIPARYGGRLSAVLDIRQREGNMKSFNGEGGVGLISARLLAEGPLVKEKSSFIVAARRSYGDLFLKLIDNNSVAYFYDINAKTNYTINDNNRLYLSGYFGRDRLGLDGIYNNGWGNATATLRWNHVFNNKLFANFSGIYSLYDYSLDILTPGSEYNWKSEILSNEVKGDFEWYPGDQHRVEFGVSNKWLEFRPGDIRPIRGSGVARLLLDNKYATEGGAYASYETTIGKLTVNGGLRYSLFIRRGEETIRTYEDNKPVRYNETLKRYEAGEVSGSRKYKNNESINTYNNIEPRASLTFVINERTSLKASYNRLYQYLHLISNTTSPTPIDIWTPSGPFTKPQMTDQYALGYFKNFKQNAYETSLEVYYKDFDNLLDYVDGADLLTNNNIETELLSGTGRAYGVELYVKKNVGKLTGWISYTLSKTERQVKGIGENDPGINNGKYYVSGYDKRHNGSVTAIYQINNRWSLSSNFIYATGIPSTYPVARYEFVNLAVPHYEGRNQERLPDYHRLDVSATLKGKTQRWKRGGHEWVFGFYNLYNRANATSIYFVENEDKPSETKAYKSYLLGITPSITYNFKF